MFLRVLLSLAACLSLAQACSVPVFRYALEHWEADPYEAIVFHRGKLSDAQQAVVQALGETGANLTVRPIDLETNPGLDAGSQTLPWVSVSLPHAGPKIWSGPLSEAAAVVDSPARREIVHRLANGQSAVWVVLESGDAAKDAAAAETLQKRLEYLASTLALPKLDEQDIANGLVSIAEEDLRLEFSTLPLSRTDPAERVLVQMLLGTERDLAESKEPIVFPVFGRGRALYALLGDGIRTENIDRAATFLIGKCSCEVKEQNPGTDLLLVSDWKSAVKAKSAPLPDLPTLAEIAKAGPQTVKIGGTPAAAPAPARGMSGLGVAAMVLLGLGVVAFLVRGR